MAWSCCNLAVEIKHLVTAVVSLQARNSPAAQTAVLVTLLSFVPLRCFLLAAILHHFPSRVWLDAAVRRCCLFPVHVSHFATSIETHLRLKQRCLLRCVSSFTYGCFTTNIELACGSNSDVCSVTHPCSSRNFLKAPGIHHFPSRAVKCL